MADYTSLGIEKIARQAATDPTIIRCPRDSAVMRVLRARAERRDGADPQRKTFASAPRGRAWRILEIDVECPACQRRAAGVNPKAVTRSVEAARAGTAG